MKKKALPFYSIFESSVYDANGDFLVVPMYNYKYSDDYKAFENTSMDLMLFRFSDLEFLDYEDRHKDGEGFISSFETHYMNMGYPTNTKKFKELYPEFASKAVLVRNSYNANKFYRIEDKSREEIIDEVEWANVKNTLIDCGSFICVMGI